MIFLPCVFAAIAALPQQPVVVASKPFGESYILAEMFAQILEARGFTVERRPGLGATAVAFAALRSGDVDVYPEYTGTGLRVLLEDTSRLSTRAAFLRVAQEFERRWGLAWMPPLGFENTYAIAVQRETAQRHGLRTLSDLARAAPQLRAGLTPDFIGRRDGLPGLSAAYGIRFREVRSLLQSVKYRALAAGEVDVIDGYSTDGLIARYDLVVLEDDRRFFPPYEAAALVSSRLAADPRAVAALSMLSGRIDVTRMRAWNQQVEVEGKSVAQVAAAALREIGAAQQIASGSRADDQRESFIRYFFARRAMIGALVLRHLMLVGVCLALACLVGIPGGLALERVGSAESVIRTVGLLQTIPGIALLAFMIPLLGIGVVPALVALFLYSLYPILRNTYSGVRAADPNAVIAAHALGMTPTQILAQVRLPIAAPIIMAGVRTAGVLAVGTATLAAFIGAGGLGDPIVSGLALSDTRMILLGAAPAALLALVIDAVLGRIEHALTPTYQNDQRLAASRSTTSY